MRYHVYTEARHPTGAVASGHSLTVYDDAAGTELSDIYAAASGGSPLANPYVVPATGIVDFWATVPQPHVSAGDNVRQPLPILVATPADIGAADLAIANTFAGQNTFSGVKLTNPNQGLIMMPTIDGDHGLGGWQWMKDEQCLTLVVGDWDYPTPGEDSPTTRDRMCVGHQAPWRMQFGETDAGGIENANMPSMRFGAGNMDGPVIDPTATAFQFFTGVGHLGTVLTVDTQSSGGVFVPRLKLDANGKLHVTGQLSAEGDLAVTGKTSMARPLEAARIVPPLGDVSNIGGGSRNYKSLILSDGSYPWALRVSPVGVVTATKQSVNYLTNPSFELDTVMAGQANDWNDWHSTVAKPTYTKIAGRTKGYAQRIQYTGQAGDVNAQFSLSTLVTPLGSFVAGDPVTLSVWAKIAHSEGASFAHTIEFYNASGTAIDSALEWRSDIWDEWYRYHTSGTCPAGTASVKVKFAASSIHIGDVIDITLDDCQLEKAAAPTDYLDGSYAPAVWEDVPNASASYKDAT